MSNKVFSSIHSGNEIDTAITKVGILENDIQSINNTSLPTLKSLIDEIDIDITKLENDLINFKLELDKKATTNEYVTQFDNINNRIDNMADRINSLNNTINTKASVASLTQQKTDITKAYIAADLKLENSVTNLGTELRNADTAILEDIDTLQANIGNEIKNLQDQITIINGVIGSGEGDENNPSSDSLITLINNMQTNIATNTTNIDNLNNTKADQTDVEDKLDISRFNEYADNNEIVIQQKADQDYVDGLYGNVSDTLSNMDTRLTNLETIISSEEEGSINKRIAALETIISSEEEGSVNKRIATLEALITSENGLNAQIQSLTDRIIALENQ